MSFIINAFSASPGVLWAPSDLSAAPKMWHNDDSVITTGSGHIITWEDMTANAQTFNTGAPGDRPTYDNSGLNGRRTLTFDGTSDYMAATSTFSKNIFTNVGAGWVFMVLKKGATDGSATGRVSIMFTNNATGTTRMLFQLGSTAAANVPRLQARRLDADSAAVLADAGAVDTGWHMWLAAMDWSNGDGFIYKDGSLSASNSSLTSSGSTSNTSAADGIFLGATTVPASFCDMSIAENIIGAGSLPSSDEIDKLFGYAAHRWGLTGNLPGGHPYESSPPYV